MKTSLLASLLLAVSLASGHAAMLGSAFTYQGRLTDAGAPANGAYDLTFTLYDASAAGTTVGTSNVVHDLGITNGLFTVALDFGAAPFDGSERWLEIAVRPGASVGDYTNVAPRQPITATPYAIRALNFSGAISNAQLAGTYDSAVNITNAANRFAGTFSGNGGGLTNLNAANLVGPVPAAALSNAWRIGGNNGTIVANNFLGTTDNQPFEIRVNNSRVLRLQPDATTQNAPSVIGGSLMNVIAPGIVGATIAGGGSADYEGNGPAPNTVGHSYGTVGGGVGNDTAGVGATIGGGYNNISVGFFTTVAGGGVNLARGDYAFVGGGLFNQATNTASTVAGGRNNRATGIYSTVGGGTHNLIGAETHGVTIGGGGSNAVFSLADWATIGGGLSNSIRGLALVAVIGGGELNRVEFGADRSVIGGGWSNSIGVDVERGTISGGENNVLEVNAAWGTIGGGARNRIGGAAYASSIGGGHDNLIFNLADRATIAGGAGNEISTNADFSAIVGGLNNRIGVGTEQAFIGGGWANSIGSSSTNSTIGGGYFNRIFTNSPGSTIAGGQENRVEQNARAATIAGGRDNVIQTNADYSFIAGGQDNVIKTGSTHGVIGGGTDNVIETAALFSTISGGIRNTTRQNYAVVPGGRLNAATGDYSFAAGHRAKAQHDGSFVWADSQNADFPSTAAQQFLIRAAGGVGIGHSVPDAPLHVVGGTDVNLTGGGILVLGAVSAGNVAFDGNEIQARNNGVASSLFFNAGGGNVSIGTVSSTARLRVVNATCDGTTWNNASDRNLKGAFEPVDARAILAQVAALPLSRWHYTNAPGTRHIGPMAQDFQAAFGVGADDKLISTVDADGVALAAIQGLNSLVKTQAEELRAIKAELAELRRAVNSRVEKATEH